DAVWLAEEKGCHVEATDLSAEMVRVGQSKGQDLPQLKFSVGGIMEVLSEKKATYDLIFSNFGGFNCLSPAEMERTGKLLAARLNPGGRFVAVIMPRYCVWESMYYLAKLRPRSAFRRRTNSSLDVPLGNGATQKTYYFGPKKLRKIYRRHLKFLRKKPIGYFLPPSYLDPFFAKRPRLLNLMDRMERRVQNRSILAGAADHFLIEFVKK
ncbi:MAG: class I SAM-dependent methyltransferase, partial [Bacteroidota bacterium]